MNTAFNKLHHLQNETHSHSNAELPDEYQDTLMFCEMAGLIKIDFYGDPSGESEAFNRLLQTIIDSDVSSFIKSIRFSAPDEGANGTRAWDFRIIVNSESAFPNLTSFYVEGTQPEHHNRSVISGDFYEEAGMMAKLIRKMPNLLSLSVPSAPNQDFFQMAPHPLRYLAVQAAYDTQNFILNLSKSSCFPNLHYLNFTDFQETYLDNYAVNCTPVSHYKELFLSAAFNQVRMMVIRNSLCSPADIAELKALREGVQLMIIKTSSDYA